MDGITFYFMAKELDAILTGARIDKVQQPERDEIVLSVRCAGENRMLLLSASADCGRACITTEKKNNPLEPPALCMLMRKHLIGGRITGIRQVSSDRILRIDMEHTDEMGDRAKKSIFCEFMGKHSNIILVSADGKIMECARHINETISSVREVLPGVPYEAPPAHGKIPFDSIDRTELSARLTGGKGELGKLIRDSVSGLSLPLAREISFRVCGEEIAYTDAPETYADKIADAVSDILSSFSPRVIVDENGKPAELMAFSYKSRAGMETREFSTLSEATEEYYRLKDAAERMQQKSASVTRTVKTNIERLTKKLALQQEAYESGARSEEYRIKGEMLTASAYLVKKGMRSVTLPNYYDENGGSLTVELDEKLSATGNAQRYFKLYKKAQVARKLAFEQINETTEELTYLEGQLENIDLCTDEASLSELREELVRTGYIKDTQSRRVKKALPPSSPIRFVSPDGTVIFAGRNNVQNEHLTFSADGEEIWLHAKNVPGSHVIIKSAAPSDETLLFAARVAARFSFSGASSNVEVDYTRRRYVKKPSGAKPGLVNYTHQHTLVVEPIELT